jgi:hypothetical protein
VIIKEVKPHHAIVEVEGDVYEIGIERKFKYHIPPLDIKPVHKKHSLNEAEIKPNSEISIQ